MTSEFSIPPRSWLFSLPLLGRGTPQVESLTGYIARVADEHGFTVSTLLHRALDWWAANTPSRVGRWKRKTEHLKLTPAINAHAAGTPWIRVLEKLTCQSSLEDGTARRLAHHFPARNFLRHHHAWCPQCYRDDERPYDRLLWSIAPVTACPIHQTLLVERCPECGSRVPVVHSRAVPGVCPRCEASLADGAPSADADEFAQWCAHAVGAYITLDPTPTDSGSLRRVSEMLHACMVAAGLPDAAALGRATGVSRITAWYWLSGRAHPDLESTLRICHALGLSLRQFIGGEIPAKLFRTQPAKPRCRRRSPHAFNAPTVSRMIDEILSDRSDDPPSMAEIGTHIGFAPRTIRAHFPQLCKKISIAHRQACRVRAVQRRVAVKQALREAVRAARAEERRLTRGSINRHIKQPGLLRSQENRNVVEQLMLNLDAA